MLIKNYDREGIGHRMDLLKGRNMPPDHIVHISKGGKLKTTMNWDTRSYAAR